VVNVRVNARPAVLFLIAENREKYPAPVQPMLVSCVGFSERRGVRGVELRRIKMFGWALFFLVVALIAALLGFGGIAGTAVGIAKLIFFVALILFAITAVVHLVRGRA
jgi:uncharacterized membrane protein YtjA (UPF0391 family)